MKSCVIIGNPLYQEDFRLDCNNSFPCIFHFLRTYGLSAVYLSIYNAYERTAIQEYRRLRRKMPREETQMTLSVYGCSPAEAAQAISTSITGLLITGQTLHELMVQVSHALVIDHPSWNPHSEGIHIIHFSAEEFHLMETQSLRKLLLWAQQPMGIAST